MFLNGKKFYMELQGYYQKENYEGAEKYLEEKSRELKCMVMPASGLGWASCPDTQDEDGLTKETREWLINRNQSIAVVTYEQARLFQNREEWAQSIKKYKDAKALMERNFMTELSIYEALLKNMELIQTQEEG